MVILTSTWKVYFFEHEIRSTLSNCGIKKCPRKNKKEENVKGTTLSWDAGYRCRIGRCFDLISEKTLRKMTLTESAAFDRLVT